MFKDTKEGTTNWYCPDCGGVCSSGVAHICTLGTNSIDNVRICLTEKGLDAIKKKLNPIPCHHCGHIIKPRKETRIACPSCHSEYWRHPALKQRIGAAIYHFKLGR